MAESNVQTSLLADRLLRDVHDAGMEGLMVAAEAVLEAAKRNLPVGDPIEDPDPAVSLRDAGRIEEHGTGVVIGFETAYAAKQHEDLRLKHPRGGGPKYLERALQEVAPGLEAIVASKVEARMAKGLLSDRSRPHR